LDVLLDILLRLLSWFAAENLPKNTIVTKTTLF
jgi:hypothetical protein